jgi:hypothetical protein
MTVPFNASTTSPPVRRCCRSRCSAILASFIPLPGVGCQPRSAIDHDLRVDPAQVGRRIRALASILGTTRVVPAGRSEPQFSMVPMNLLTPGATSRLHRDSGSGREGSEGGEESRP